MSEQIEASINNDPRHLGNDIHNSEELYVEMGGLYEKIGKYNSITQKNAFGMFLMIATVIYAATGDQKITADMLGSSQVIIDNSVFDAIVAVGAIFQLPLNIISILSMNYSSRAAKNSLDNIVTAQSIEGNELHKLVISKESLSGNGFRAQERYLEKKVKPKIRNMSSCEG